MLCFGYSQSWWGPHPGYPASLGCPKLGKYSLALWVTIWAFAVDSKCLLTWPLTRRIEAGPSETSQLFLLTMQHLPRQNNQKTPFPLRFFVNACLGSCNNLKDEKVCILQNKTKPNLDKEWLSACGNSIRASLIHNKNAFYSSEKRKSCKLPCW